jgi:hypothetical protein
MTPHASVTQIDKLRGHGEVLANEGLADLRRLVRQA